jgi:phenylpropionate dioxygenase-like ring-hydroxylating dioxygenase large terminal subunit
MFISHKTDLVDQHSLPLIQFDNKKFVSKNRDNFLLINNICPHQGSLIVRHDTTEPQCHYHGWSWDISGNPVSNGSTKVCNNFALKSKDLYVENSLVLSKKVQLDEINSVDLSYMTLVEKRIDSLKTVHSNIIDVFLDVDHIPVAHRGVYESIGISGKSNINWKYYDWGSIQIVDNATGFSNEFKETLLGIKDESLSAFWITIYPHTMIEWQPGAMFVTVCVPRNKNLTDVCVFKYRDTRYNDLNWKINSEIWETAWRQDKELSESIVATNSRFFEESKLHFRQWLKDNDELRI